MARAAEVEIRVPVASTKWRLYAVGDIHWGSTGCAEDHFRRTVKEIRNNEHAYWIGMGDYIDAVTHNDKKRFDPKHYEGTRYQISDLARLPKLQKDELLTEVDSIKDKCLGLIEGNHEWVVPKWNAQDIMWEFVNGIGAPYLGAAGFVRIRVVDDAKVKSDNGNSRYSIVVFAVHGYGGTRLSGADALALGRLVAAVRGVDVYFFGHRHKQIVLPHSQIYLDRSSPPKIRDVHCVGGMTGSYLKSYVQDQSDYAERSVMPPTVLGSPYVEVWAERPNTKGKQGSYVPMFQMQHSPLPKGGYVE